MQINPFDSQDINGLVRISVKNEGKSYRVALNDQPGVTQADWRDPLLLILRVEAGNPKDGRYDLDTKLWVNPDLSTNNRAVQNTECALKSVTFPGKMGIRIFKGHGQSWTRLDEIRYGWHWDDVTMKKGTRGAD